MVGLGDPLVAALVLVVVAFLPPVAFALLLRNAERRRREPWRGVALAFLWGASGGAFLALLAQVLADPFLRGATFLLGIPLSYVVLAPLSEELAKILGILNLDDADPEPEDGLVYGGAAGLGFAATENVLYIGSAFLLGGQEVATFSAAYRGLVAVSLHGGASALAGYGVWRARRVGGSAWEAAPFVLVAVAVHALYNGLTLVEPAWGPLAAALLALVVFARVLQRVRSLDEAGGG